MYVVKTLYADGTSHAEPFSNWDTASRVADSNNKMRDVLLSGVVVNVEVITITEE